MTIGFILSFKLPLVFILISVGTAVYYDVANHGSFSKSITGKWLKNSGVLGVYQATTEEISTKSPVFIASVYKAANVDKIKDGILSGYRYSLHLVEPVTTWIFKNIPFRLDYANDVVIPKIAKGISRFTTELGSYLYAGQENLKEMTLHLGSWIKENINSENVSFVKIHSAFSKFVYSIQSTLIDAFNWTHQQLVG